MTAIGESAKFTLEVAFTDDDCARATRFILYRRYRWLGKPPLYLWPVLVVIGLGLSLWIKDPGAISWWFVPALFVLLIWFLLLFTFAQKSGLRRQMRKQLSSNPSARTPQTFTISDEGINVSGALFDTRLDWNAIVESVESKSDFFLYLSRNWAYFLPKRYFAGEDQQQELRNILTRNLRERAKVGTDR